MKALNAVGDILQYYDHDKLIPAYGFGAKVQYAPRQFVGDTMHAFALNGDAYRPDINGILGVQTAYWHALPYLFFHGPTNFSPIIQKVIDRARECEVSQYNQQYNVLLILTDGAISDMQNTIDTIVDGADLPISIIIVGVGDADFSPMEQLDADDAPLFSESKQKYMSRDIVQFVPFNQFAHDPMQLAKCTLAELPAQVVDFFLSKKIKPLPSQEAQRKAIQVMLQ